MNKRISVISFLIAVVISHSTYAADDKGNYIVLGFGSNSCGKFIEDIKTPQGRIYYGNWLGGYLTGFNQFSSKIVSITGSTDFDGVFSWVVQRCEQNPLESFGDAAFALIVQLIPNAKK